MPGVKHGLKIQAGSLLEGNWYISRLIGPLTHHTPGVAIGSEQSQFSIIATIHLHALKALGCVVQHRCGWGNGEVSVWAELWGLPTSRGLPHSCDHMVGTLGAGVNDGVSQLGNGHGGGGLGDLQLGGIERLEMGGGLELLGHGSGGELSSVGKG